MQRREENRAILGPCRVEGWHIGEAVVFLSIKGSSDKLSWRTEGHQADVSGGQLVCGMPGQTDIFREPHLRSC